MWTIVDILLRLDNNWKEKRVKAAVEKARAEGYEKGYADGRAGVEVHRQGHRIVKRESDAIATTHISRQIYHPPDAQARSERFPEKPDAQDRGQFLLMGLIRNCGDASLGAE